MMKPADMALAVLTSLIWGLSFVAIEFGLESFSASQLTALRFIIAALPVVFLSPPRTSWRLLVLIGTTLFAAQFLLLFLAYEQGMPPGLASVTQQTQACFTVSLAALFLSDIPTPRQTAGMVVAFIGLGVVGMTIGGDITLVGFGLAIAAAMCWAIGNVLVKHAGQVSMFALMAWASLIPPVPALALSAIEPEGFALTTALANASWLSLAAAIYLGAAGTSLAYALWGYLLARYPTSVVTPFALLAPCVGMASSALIFGESFGLIRGVGMAIILAGIAAIILPPGLLKRFLK